MARLVLTPFAASAASTSGFLSSVSMSASAPWSSSRGPAMTRRGIHPAVDIEVALHRTLFEQAPIGVCVYDRSLHITACNERFAEILGSTIERIRGLDLN